MNINTIELPCQASEVRFIFLQRLEKQLDHQNHLLIYHEADDRSRNGRDGRLRHYLYPAASWGPVYPGLASRHP